MLVKIFLIMILLHIIDDFVLQPICLSKLKQRSWWEIQFKKNKALDKKKYESDYLTAGVIHALSWSIMIMLPIIYLYDNDDNGVWLYVIVAMNTLVHFIVDNEKANFYAISLKKDQIIHIFQIFVTLLVCSQWIRI